jgi:hypothetical protein
MGSFSIWHVLTAGLQLVLVIAVVGAIAYFLLRTNPAAPAKIAASPVGEGGTTNLVATSPKPTSEKVIAITYLVGGLFGVITTLPQVNGVSLDLMSAIAWLILITQIAAAIYGAWCFWNHKPIGAQLLYWLSWSCVPVISFSTLSYWCAIGLALFPTITLSPGNIGTDFSLRFGYVSRLWFNTDTAGILLGVNVIALLFVSMLTKFMQ